MNRFLLFVFAFAFHLNADAQNTVFVRGDIGSNLSNKSFTYTDVSVEVGYGYKGIEALLALNGYSNAWGRSSVQYINTTVYDDKSYNTHSERPLTHATCIMVSASIGYDLFKLVKVNSHHIIPFLAIGYCNMTKTQFDMQVEEGIENISFSEKNENGIEPMIGIRYEYDLSSHFAIGAFYKMNFNIHETDICGVSLRYNI